MDQDGGSHELRPLATTLPGSTTSRIGNKNFGLFAATLRRLFDF